MTRNDTVWKDPNVAKNFLEGVRGGIPYAIDQLNVMLRLLAANNKPVERFLDLGSGGGALATAVLAQYPNAQAILVDFSEPMLARARERLPQAQIVIADLSVAEWKDSLAALAPVDAVVSGFAIHHLPHTRKQALYREIYDLLKPSGFFINIEHVAPGSAWVEAVFSELMIDSMWDYHHRNGADFSREQVATDFVNRGDKIANILAPLDDQCNGLREIGYTDVDCYFKIFELAVFGGRRKE